MIRRPSKASDGQVDLFGDDWLVPTPVIEPLTVIPTNLPHELTPSEFRDVAEPRFALAVELSHILNREGVVTKLDVFEKANAAFGGTRAEGKYSNRDAYDAMESAFNLHLLHTEKSTWTELDADEAVAKIQDLTSRVRQGLLTQTVRDSESDEFQQFSTPPAHSFAVNWVANITKDDCVVEPSAGTGDLAIWAHIAGATVVLNELSERRRDLLASLFPASQVFGENAEQLDNVLPDHVKPTVIVMNPPFSSTAGRLPGERDSMIGAKHVEQALNRLEEGGRLVAIVGNSMAFDRPAFREWWSKTSAQYNVKANIGIEGEEYVKYGTTFDNNIIVIDKTGPTTKPVLTGFVNSVFELPHLLQGVRNERLPIESSSPEYPVPSNFGEQQHSGQSDTGAGRAGAAEGGVGAQPAGNAQPTRTPTSDRKNGERSEARNENDDRVGGGNGILPGINPLVSGSGSGNSGGNSSLLVGQAGGIAIESGNTAQAEFTESVFSNYTPQRLNIAGATPHPGKLVQSAAMAAVLPPFPRYAPTLNQDVVASGKLSIAQLESLVYAGQAHAQKLPNGSRKGFFIGDGTGVGKGREISGVILDNLLQGREKAVWISFNDGLMNDAKRDFAGVGGDPDLIFGQGKTKAADTINAKKGVLFTTYSTMRSGEKKSITQDGEKGGKTRVQQIVDWVGKDFDGVIAFDEAHCMGNSMAVAGKRGTRKASQQAIAGINLQRELPNARVLYVSATGATEVSNLGYADRLGLWGEGTPFPNVSTFNEKVSSGGIAAMELVSRDMKALGMYMARSLSYDGVTYERMEHNLTEFQEDVYNELAGCSW